MAQLTQKTILITGGTSRLGEAYVRAAKKAGANIYFTYHSNQDKAKELQALGAVGFSLDLSDMRAIDEFVANFKTHTKRLDVLIHNAAAIRDRTLQNLTEEDWDYVMNVDLKAPYYLTKKLLSPLFKSEMGKIFFITSRASVMAGFGISNYAAAKAGLVGLSKSLAQELGKKNILVNTVNPGFMISGMTQNLPQKILDYHSEISALSRHSSPDEVADFLVYLSSDAMTQATGQMFHFESRKIN